MTISLDGRVPATTRRGVRWSTGCTPAAWAAIRRFRLQEADANDAYAWTFCRLVEHLDSIRDPEAVGAGWRRPRAASACASCGSAARRAHRRSRRGLCGLLDDDPFEREDEEARRLAVWTAFETLSEACKRLLRAAYPRAARRRTTRSAPSSACPAARSVRRCARCLERLRQALPEAA